VETASSLLSTLIAILAAILFPIFASAKATARKTQCANNMSQIGRAIKSYTSDWNGCTPVGAGMGHWGTMDNWPYQIFVYIGNDPTVYFCPDRKFKTMPNIQDNTPSYGLNWLCSAGWSTDNPMQGNTAYAANTAKLIMCYEASPKVASTFNYADWDYTNDGQTDGTTTYSASTEPYWMYFPGPHRDTLNILFADGHVRGFKTWDSNAMTFNPGKS
jgi:prepilin-type processing-associated H-X9-DG protein